MRRLKILTWHTHGSYLYYLTQVPHDFFLNSRFGPHHLGVEYQADVNEVREVIAAMGIRTGTAHSKSGADSGARRDLLRHGWRSATRPHRPERAIGTWRL